MCASKHADRVVPGWLCHASSAGVIPRTSRSIMRDEVVELSQERRDLGDVAALGMTSGT
jgi:hypothetical protein